MSVDYYLIYFRISFSQTHRPFCNSAQAAFATLFRITDRQTNRPTDRPTDYYNPAAVTRPRPRRMQLSHKHILNT